MTNKPAWVSTPGWACNCIGPPQTMAVTSEAMRSVGYCLDHQVMEIVFPSGAKYRYYGVAVNRVRDLVNAKSIGEHFNNFIRNHGFKYQREG